MEKIIKQFFRFAVTGTSCFAIDFALMVLLKEVFGVYYLAASIISFCSATAVNYIISVKWVYFAKDSSIKPFEMFVFILLSIIGLIINTFLVWVFVEKIGIYYIPAKALAGIISGFYNFITRKIYLER